MVTVEVLVWVGMDLTLFVVMQILSMGCRAQGLIGATGVLCIGGVEGKGGVGSKAGAVALMLGDFAWASHILLPTTLLNFFYSPSLLINLICSPFMSCIIHFFS